MELRWLERSVDQGDGTAKRERVLQYRDTWTELSTEGVIGIPCMRYGTWKDVPVVREEDLPAEPPANVQTLPHLGPHNMIDLLTNMEQPNVPMPDDMEELYVK